MTEHRGDGQPCPESVGIAGLGLIGGSVAKAIRTRWPSVHIAACDRPECLAAAREAGIIDQAVETAAELASSKLIVLAVPIPAMGEMVSAIAGVAPEAIVTDVGSTKRVVCGAAVRAGLTQFVGGHPMAGIERAGLENARADLFEGRPWLLVTPAPAPASDVVVKFVEGLGARVQWTTAESHDRMMAYVSHAPQLLATTLMHVAARHVGAEGLAAAGPGFVDMTRLAASPADVWAGILGENADFAAEALAHFVEALPGKEELGSDEWVREAFDEANALRRRWRPPGPPVD